MSDAQPTGMVAGEARGEAAALRARPLHASGATTRGASPAPVVGGVPVSGVPARAERALSVGEIILRRRLALDLTQEQVAHRAGIAKSYVCQIENQVRKGPPSAGVLRALERALHLEAGHLEHAAGWQAMPESLRRAVSNLQGSAAAIVSELRTASGLGRGGLDALHRSGRLAQLVASVERASPVPTLGAPGGPGVVASPAAIARAGGAAYPEERPVRAELPARVPLINAVAAGHPREFTDLGYPARVADEYVASMDVQDRDAFASRVVGDSMAPDYREGDIVVFSPLRPVQSGMDCFVRLEPDHETTFKRVFFEGGEGPAGAGASSVSGQCVRLKPLNSRYPERVVPRERVAGLYAAVSVTRAL